MIRWWVTGQEAGQSYSIGLFRGVTIAVPLAIAAHYAAERPLFACAWLVTAAIYLLGSRRERREEERREALRLKWAKADALDTLDDDTRGAVDMLDDMRADRDRWEAEAGRLSAEVEHLRGELAAERARRYL